MTDPTERSKERARILAGDIIAAEARGQPDMVGKLAAALDEAREEGRRGRDELVAALNWYAEHATALCRYLESKPPKFDSIEAVIQALSLDNGQRARRARGEAGEPADPRQHQSDGAPVEAAIAAAMLDPSEPAGGGSADPRVAAALDLALEQQRERIADYLLTHCAVYVPCEGWTMRPVEQYGGVDRVQTCLSDAIRAGGDRDRP